MLPPAFTNTPDSSDSLEEHDFEQLVQDAITAVKNGNRSLAVKLFEQAAMINDTDVRIWVWMSATTDDLEERRKYLEHAVALDPSNSTAKRGLMLLTAKLDQSRLVPEGKAVVPPTAPTVEEATTKTYLCPNCGASISYSIHDTVLVCQFCGFTRKVDQTVASESKDQPLDTILPTTRAQRWAGGQARVTCEQCGVVMILPSGQTADTCPYCGSNRFITSSSLVEMVDPQVIGPFKIDPKDTGNYLKAWLGKGWLAPDNLASEHGGMQLHPGYYPFWLFEGTLEIPWFCDVNVGTGRIALWEAHNGSHFENFKDVLIPGLRKLVPSELDAVMPFNTSELVEFSPDYLAGWPALTYDVPLADASLKAREKVTKNVQLSIDSLVEVNHPKRNFSTGAGKWSGLTYKLALLPIYIGNYVYQGKRYRLLVNGQTGKVSGKKPIDNIKLTIMIVIGIFLLFVLLAIILFLGRTIAG
jgi:DNA-directed RNA polymerase subunit RPC12/RpoP